MGRFCVMAGFECKTFITKTGYPDHSATLPGAITSGKGSQNFWPFNVLSVLKFFWHLDDNWQFCFVSGEPKMEKTNFQKNELENLYYFIYLKLPLQT